MNNFNPQYLLKKINENISINGYVYKIEKSSGLSFVYLRNGKFIYQAVYIPDLCKTPLSELCEGAYVTLNGSIVEEKRAEHGFEITIKSFEVISLPKAELPCNTSQSDLGISIDNSVADPSSAIRHMRTQCILSLRSGISYAFSQFMQKMCYISINTPKITTLHTKSNYVRVNYFDKQASLTNSPALYKIMAVGGLDRVYEVGAGYSSKHGNSLRHLNEYTRLDFESAYASQEDTISIVKSFISYMTEYISQNFNKELSFLNADINTTDNIPTITHADAMAFLQKPINQPDLDPTDERKLCEYSKERYGSDCIFVTNMPQEKRPFYEKDGTGFVLLCNCIEVASGGEHISDYDEQIKKLTDRKMDINDYTPFLQAHKYALPQISGVAIGLERLVMAFLKLTNIREATFITRDFNHTIP